MRVLLHGSPCDRELLSKAQAEVWEITKGKEVAVEGKLTTRSYDDKEGNKRYMTEVVCNELLMLGNK